MKTALTAQAFSFQNAEASKLFFFKQPHLLTAEMFVENWCQLLIR